MPFLIDILIPFECLSCLWRCPRQYLYLWKCPPGTCHRTSIKYIGFFKLSIITHRIPFRIIKIAYPKPTQLPRAAKSLCGRRKTSLPRAQPPCCSAKLVFQSLVFAAVKVVQDTQTAFLCVNGEVSFAFDWSEKVQIRWLDLLLPAMTALCFTWLCVGSRDPK